MSPRQPYGLRLAAAMAEYGRLCVGLDPHPGMLSSWGLGEDAAGLREFGERVLEAASGRAAVIKPQVAFYERHGVAGLQALAETMRSARQAGLLVIADAKRGDIGSTMAGYAEAWLHPDSDFAADALTVSPYLGFGSLHPAVEAALEHGAGLHVLALTSNPEGAEVQLARQEDGTAVASRIIEEAAAAGRGPRAGGGSLLGDGGSPDQSALSSIGLVVGATTAQLAARAGADLTAGMMPILAPGYGAQGAGAAQLRQAFGAAYSRQTVVSASRSILSRGPGVAGLSEAIDEAQTELA